MSDFVVNKDAESTIAATCLKDYKVPAYLIDDVNLQFDLQDAHTLVTSHLKIRRNRLSTDRDNELKLDGEDLVLQSLKLNNQILQPDDYTIAENALLLCNLPDKFELEIITKIFPAKNTALSGLYLVHETYCTQCEAEGFRRITYFLDHPDILARYTTTIVADEKKFPYLLSNGNLIASGKLEDGRHYTKWEDPFKKPSYLFALVGGDFDLRTDSFTTVSGHKVALRLYVEKGCGDQTEFALQALKEAMHWDEKTYGREYDLDVYMIVAIGDFNMGAMENKGLNIFNTKYVLAKPATATDDDYIYILSVIGHEYFHNWSGNRVTCRDWFQLSLKEGLTIFRDQSFTEDLISPSVMRIREVNYLREIQFPEDAGPLAHPVRPESYIEINNFYTATVYNKGAEILRMLRTIIGPVIFRKGMDLYFARHDGQAVTIEDFIQTMEDVSGANLNQFRLWYSQAGTPTVNATDDYDGTNKVYTLTFSQTCPSTPQQNTKEPMFIPVRMGLIDQQGKALMLYFNKEKGSTEKILHLQESSQIYQFNDVPSRPIPSLLRDFSAPVILDYPYSDSDLITLIKYDDNFFNRYEAAQKYTLRIMLNLIRDYQQQRNLSIPEDLVGIFTYLLQHETQDKFFLAEMLLLPSEKYLGEQMDVIDVDAIHAVREFILQEISVRLSSILKETYKKNSDNSPYKFELAAVGKRQVKNRCLAYLMQSPSNVELGMQQFNDALTVSMTDTQAALIALTNLDTPFNQQVLNQFYSQWKYDALVVDKWFAIQAATKLPNALQQVKKLMHHEAFNIKNPNKVYALIGTFSQRNQANFHVENGEGYAFLRDVVQQLDKLNPQIAARMVKPLTTWKRYDKERQTQMREQLELLLQDNKISRDLYELVVKSLN